MRKLLLSLTLIFFGTHLSWGWGHDGHCIIANIAEDHLNAAARQSLHQMIGDEHLCSIASWADEITRDRPDTRPWHYVDIPLNANGFSFVRDCMTPRPGDCVVAKIDEFESVLRSPSESFETRAEALYFVVHFVGDIHQPMHAAKEARGGNDIKVLMFGSPVCGRYACNLHSAWDSGLILHKGLDDRTYADQLEQMIVRDHLAAKAGGRPEKWANESLALAKTVWVDSGTNMDESYYARNIGALDQRLALAGLRLAAVLNNDLGSQTFAPHGR